MMKSIFSLFLLLIGVSIVNAQGVGINETNSTADPSAILDVSSSDKGLLTPRLTTVERFAIASPSEGLLVFDTDYKCFAVYKMAAWYLICGTVDPSYSRVLSVVSGNSQTGCPSTTLSNPITVRVVDGNGTPVSGESLSFAINSGSGAITASAVTNASGEASVSWTLGASGTQAASVSGVSMTTQPLTASLAGFIASTGTVTDVRDGLVYNTVTYCNGQTWMSQNLRYSNGGTVGVTVIPVAAYGRLYDWNDIMQGTASSNAIPSGVQGLCPSGWHIPSDAEWQAFETYVGITNASSSFSIRGTTQGTDMKSTTGWSGTGNGTNILGFNVLPAGTSTTAGVNSGQGNAGYIWTSTQATTSSQAWYRTFDSSQTGIGRFPFDKKRKQSCRCLKD